MSAEQKCSSCNTCQGCNSCQYCNSCQGCVNAEDFGGKSAPAANFSPSSCFNNGETIVISHQAWNDLMDAIYAVRARGTEHDNLAGFDHPSAHKVSQNGFITAETFNYVARGLAGTSAYSAPTVSGGPNGTLIYGSYFDDIREYANKMKYQNNQCDTCVWQGNTECPTCQRCVISQSPPPTYITTCCGCNTSCESNQTSTE